MLRDMATRVPEDIPRVSGMVLRVYRATAKYAIRSLEKFLVAWWGAEVVWWGDELPEGFEQHLSVLQIPRDFGTIGRPAGPRR